MKYPRSRKFLTQLIPHLTIAGFCIVLAGCETLSFNRKAKRAQILQPRADVPAPYIAPATAPVARTIERPVAPNPGINHEMAELRPQLMPLPEAHIQTIEKPAIKIVEPLPRQPKEQQPLPDIEKVELIKYTVKKGDTLWDIARMYGVTSKELSSFNGIKNPKSLSIGMTVQIPPGGAFVPLAKRPPVEKKKTPKKAKEITRVPIPQSGKYTVKKGDSLWEIGRKFGVTVKDLKALNSLPNNTLQPGQVLVLKASRVPGTINSAPRTTTAPATVPGQKTPPISDGDTGPKIDQKDLKNLPHYVAEGDTLESISEMYGSRVEWILNVNSGIKSDANLEIGKEIMVPCPDL